jgi:hypothetical protein
MRTKTEFDNAYRFYRADNRYVVDAVNDVISPAISTLFEMLENAQARIAELERQLGAKQISTGQRDGQVTEGATTNEKARHSTANQDGGAVPPASTHSITQGE